MTRHTATAFALLFVFSVFAHADDPLHGIEIVDEHLGPACSRDTHFGRWSDDDRDGEDTRQEVLIAESLLPVTRDSEGKVVEGLWVGPYAGFVTRTRTELDIDHMVPLCEAWRSGPHAWTKPQRVDFANSLSEDHHLIATWYSTNRSKRDKDPSEWLPPNRAYWCIYFDNWVAIKRTWGTVAQAVPSTCAGTSTTTPLGRCTRNAAPPGVMRTGTNVRNGPRELDSAVSGIFLGFQAAKSR